MIFGYITLFVAFFLSAVAAYYSVLGLVAIFSAAAIPVIIMGGALETGKVVAAMWLHRNWHRAPWTYKAYLLPSLLALMLLTSMGTFGYLSKAHSDQSLVSGDVQSKIAIYDEKIRISRENIDANRAALKQLDAAVDQIMGRSTTEQGAERSVQIRRQQAPERQRLIREIEAEQKKISELNEARAPIAAEVRKVEAEVGPIKYIAALLYGDNPENNLLESAVRWVIILIVIVFDPLAIVLILAGTRHLEWERTTRSEINPDYLKTIVESKSESVIESISDIPKPVEPIPETTAVEQPKQVDSIPELIPDPPKPVEQVYLTQPWRDHVPGIRVPHQVYQPQNIELTEGKQLSQEEIGLIRTAIIEKEHNREYEQVSRDHVRIDGQIFHKDVLQHNGYGHILKEVSRNNFAPVTFGRSWPDSPEKGDMHVDIANLPSRLYKFNGDNWIEVNKELSDLYTHNAAYILFLIEKIENRELSLEDLTEAESDMIMEYLKNAKSINNSTG